jgi:hypothetical protein
MHILIIEIKGDNKTIMPYEKVSENYIIININNINY